MQSAMAHFVHQSRLYTNSFNPLTKIGIALVQERGFRPVSNTPICCNELLFLTLSEEV